MTDLSVENLTVTVGETALVRNASFTLRPGDFIALLGPNGAGKTSLLRASLGLEPSTSGSATLNGEDTAKLSASERALKLSYLPQIRSLAWPNRVADIVALGRFAHGSTMGRLRAQDKAAVERALDACELTAFADRKADTLSGGELARVHCARAFAAEAPLLVADEPTAALDPRHQFKVFDLIKRFVADGGGALVVLHDVDLAVRYATSLIWMKEGNVIAQGSPAETHTAEMLAEIYSVSAREKNGRIEMEGAL
ncbi:MAG: ABC transporter ATP-binding protein [Pseudomonadota bacterium]